MEHTRVNEIARVSYSSQVSDKKAKQAKINYRKTCIKCGSPLNTKNRCTKCGVTYVFGDVFASELRKN